MKPNEFIKYYLPYAEENEKETGVPALATLAQAALESGWGQHAPGNNFFGIKAGKSWKGEIQVLTTHEFEGDKTITIKQTFRKYASPLDSFKDHAALLKKRWPKAFTYTDPVQFINAVQNEHPYKYATDPDYLRKMSQLIYLLMDEKKRGNL
ncbi:MAG TPA: peptidoglycan hydrolase [Acinetobacter junii]|nr:peptidoglycan hydrolase [Acinetobacter junii]